MTFSRFQPPPRRPGISNFSNFSSAEPAPVEAAVPRCVWCAATPADGGSDATGSPWCAACRDAEHAGQSEGRDRAVADARDYAAAWRGAARELGEIADWPRLTFKPGHAVAPGAAAWMAFAARATAPDMQLVVAALRQYLDALPAQPPRNEEVRPW